MPKNEDPLKKLFPEKSKKSNFESIGSVGSHEENHHGFDALLTNELRDINRKINQNGGQQQIDKNNHNNQ